MSDSQPEVNLPTDLTPTKSGGTESESPEIQKEFALDAATPYAKVAKVLHNVLGISTSTLTTGTNKMLEGRSDQDVTAVQNSLVEAFGDDPNHEATPSINMLKQMSTDEIATYMTSPLDSEEVNDINRRYN